MAYSDSPVGHNRYEVLSGVPGGWTVPSGFKFPTTSDYVSGVAGGMAAVRPIVESKVESFIAPIKAQASGVIATVESSVNKVIPIGGDVSSILASAKAIGNSKDALSALVSVDALLQGTLQFSTDLAKAVPQLSYILKIAPKVVGAANLVIGLAIEVISMVASYMPPSAEQLAKECKARLNQTKAQQCSSFVKSELDVIGTAVGGGVSPADLFRTYAYSHLKTPETNYQRRPPIPLSLGSMYVGLCGDMVPSPWRKTARSVGKMSDTTRSQMWMLIQGIMQAIEDPNKPPKASAGGMALYPALQGLIWKEFENGRLTEADIGSLAEQVGDQRVAIQVYQTAYCGELCGSLVKDDLYKAFMQNKVGFRSQYYVPELGWDRINERWRLSSISSLRAVTPTSRLALVANSDALSAALNATAGYGDSTRTKGRTVLAGLAAGTAISVAVGAAWKFLSKDRIARS